MSTTDFQRKSLDNILPGDGEKAAPETTPEVKSSTEVQPETAAPADDGEDDVATEVNGQKHVPLGALQRARRTAREREEAWEKRDRERDQAWQRERNEMWRQHNETLARLAPQHLRQEPPEFGTPEYFQHAVAPYVQPVFQQNQRLEAKLHVIEAGQVFGSDLEEFKTHVMELAQRGDPEYNTLNASMQASNQPFVVAKQWFDRRKVLNEIGPDPAAYREKLKAEILAEMQGNPPPNGGINRATAPVMPSNLAGARNVGSRSGPQWTGPTPLGDIFNRKRPGS